MTELSTNGGERTALRAPVGLKRFAGKRALVFGGSSGIGAATAERLAEEGATVCIADRQNPADARATWIHADALEDDAVDLAFASADAEMGGIDLVVNSIGVTLEASVADTALEDWNRVIQLDLTAAFQITRAAIRMLPRGTGASIVHVASDAGLVGWPDQAAYCAAKGGLVHLVKAAALDAAAMGIRVNCVCPSFTLTPLAESWIAAMEDPGAARAEVEGMQPLGRMAMPQEIAAGIAWLSSDEAGSVTGIALPIDGGVSAQ